jgi:hypothetical protein
MCVFQRCAAFFGSAIWTLASLYELSEPASWNVLDGSVLRCGAVDLSNDRRHFPFDIWYMYYSAGSLCDFCPGYVHMHTGNNRKFPSVKNACYRATRHYPQSFCLSGNR